MMVLKYCKCPNLTGPNKPKQINNYYPIKTHYKLTQYPSPKLNPNPTNPKTFQPTNPSLIPSPSRRAAPHVVLARSTPDHPWRLCCLSIAPSGLVPSPAKQKKSKTKSRNTQSKDKRIETRNINSCNMIRL
ncbi:hypothetical protein V6Z11_A08G198800 [Gossypium hirsutum]